MSDSSAADEHNSGHSFAVFRTGADSRTANEQKSEQRYETTFVSLPYRRRIFHSFREAGEQKDLPGNAF